MPKAIPPEEETDKEKGKKELPTPTSATTQTGTGEPIAEVSPRGGENGGNASEQSVPSASTTAPTNAPRMVSSKLVLLGLGLEGVVTSLEEFYQVVDESRS